jgi:ABC-type multidrug transport system ATPase subunit
MVESRSNGQITFFEDTDIDEVSLQKHGQSFGMCPQYNAIWDQMTVEESLNLMALIKGLSPSDKKHNIDLICDMMDLDPFRKTIAGNLSGGNKRKLSCALTLVVCPKLEFLDEPTAGVDPVSRRALFKMIKQLSQSG